MAYTQGCPPSPPPSAPSVWYHFWHQVLQGFMPAFQALREAGHLPLLDTATGAAELRGACSFLVNATTGQRAADPDCHERMLLPTEPPNPSSVTHGLERRGPTPLFIYLTSERWVCAAGEWSLPACRAQAPTCAGSFKFPDYWRFMLDAVGNDIRQGVAGRAPQRGLSVEHAWGLCVCAHHQPLCRHIADLDGACLETLVLGPSPSLTFDYRLRGVQAQVGE